MNAPLFERSTWHQRDPVRKSEDDAAQQRLVDALAARHPTQAALVQREVGCLRKRLEEIAPRQGSRHSLWRLVRRSPPDGWSRRSSRADARAVRRPGPPPAVLLRTFIGAGSRSGSLAGRTSGGRGQTLYRGCGGRAGRGARGRWERDRRESGGSGGTARVATAGRAFWGCRVVGVVRSAGPMLCVSNPRW
jgi:hypothetical protein